MFSRILVSILIFAACVARADDDNLLLWFFEDPIIKDVDGSTISGGAGGIVGRGEAAGKTVNAVRISVKDSSGHTVYLNLSDTKINASDRKNWTSWVGLPALTDKGDLWFAGPGYADLSELTLSDTGLTFMMELGHVTLGADGVDWTLLASSEGAALKDLVDGGHIIANELSAQGTFDWGGAGYAVPEPSSGLLVLIGGALLALRRRRKDVTA